jgi:hypothetical protein
MTLPQHLASLAALRRARVDYLMVGALALGHYAPDMASFYMTGDCDILVRPTSANLSKTLKLLRRRGYTLSINAEPLIELDALTLKRLLERRIAVRAEKADSLPIDVLTDAIGDDFAAWWEGRTYFVAGGARIPCASLEQIIRSKKAAGRDKDKKILSLYRTLLKSPPKKRA